MTREGDANVSPGVRMSSSRTLLVAGALALASPAVAAPGDHIQAGPAEIIPSVRVGFEVWTNSYLSPWEDLGGAPYKLGAVFLLEPALKINVDHSKVRFQFDGRYPLRKFMQQDLGQDLDRFSDVDLGFRLDILPEGTVGVYLADRLQIRNQASDQARFEGSLITRLQNDLEAGVPFRFGPGMSLTPYIRYTFQNTRLPGPTGKVPFNNRNTPEPGLNFHWRFFPNTMFVIEGLANFHRRENHFVESNGSAGSFLGLPDADFVKVRTGLRGRITRHLILTATLGYGYGNYKEATVDDEAGGNAEAGATGQDSYAKDVTGVDALLATVQFGFDIGHSERKTFGQMVTLRFLKDFDDSFFTNYVHYYDTRVGLDSLWGRYLRSSIGGGIRFEEYKGEIERNDTFWTADARLDIVPARYMVIGVGVQYAQRFSGDQSVSYDNIVGSVDATFTY